MLSNYAYGRRNLIVIVIGTILLIFLFGVVNVASQTGNQAWSTPQTITETDNMNFTFYDPKIAVDGNRSWHVIYVELGFDGYTYIKYKNSNLESDTVIQAFSSGICQGNRLGDPDIAVDSNGHLHVIYLESEHLDVCGKQKGSIKYVNNISGSWSTPQTITEIIGFSSEPHGYSIVHPRIAVDGNGNWHVTYGETNQDSFGTHSYIRYKNSNLELDTIVQAYYTTNTCQGNFILDPDLAIDSNGNLHVIYREEEQFGDCNEVAKDSIKYANNAFGAWSIPQILIPEVTGIYIDEPTIAVDINGNWHATYREPKDDPFGSYSYIKYKNSNLESDTVVQSYLNAASCKGNYTFGADMTVDSNGFLHIIYQETEQNDCNGDAKDSIKYVNNSSTIPVLLVHGWQGSGEMWDELVQILETEGIPYYYFNYSPALGNPQEYANETYIERYGELKGQERIGLKGRIQEIRDTTEYKGKFDIVCHSMGALVSRWYMEELDGAKNIRQWIGIAPVNHGAALADKGDKLVPDILGWGPLPDITGTEEAIKHLKTYSPTVTELNKDGTDPNVKYRVIVGNNPSHIKNFSPPLAGRTILKKNYGKYYITYQGDGVVANEQSKLWDLGMECFGGSTHTNIYTNSYVIERIIEYLKVPSKKSINNNCQENDPDDRPFSIGRIFWEIIFKNQKKSIPLTVDESANEILIKIAWPGSDLNLGLISPTGLVMEHGIYPVLDYWKGDNNSYYIIDSPEPGIWTAEIEAIDVPEEGEPYTFMTIISSHLNLEFKTAEGRNIYDVGEIAKIEAWITENDIPITGASVRSEVKKPDGVIHEIFLYDDGSHEDTLANDGKYTNVYSLALAGVYSFNVFASGTESKMFERTDYMTLWVYAHSTITNLSLHKAGPTWLNMTWLNPLDPDFSHVMLYLNGSFKTNITAPQNQYNFTGLEPDTLYELGTHTVDISGNINGTWVNVTARTMPSDAVPPVADCGAEISGCENVGNPVQFNGSASYDPDGAVISYYWEFGDGVNSTDVAPKHTYSAHRWNGTAYQPFIVNLTVIDNSGLTNSTSQNVTIWIAGDANGDGNVNILDASVVGLKWGGNDPCADLNNDGIVNILDASIIGLNWGRSP